MESSTKKYTGLYWVLFLLSVAAFFFVYSIGGGYCSMVLPFNCTFFDKAMYLMYRLLLKIVLYLFGQVASVYCIHIP